MEATTQNDHHRRRLRLAGGILKALFTTSPKNATEVVVFDDGPVVVRPAPEDPKTDDPSPTAVG